MNALCSPHEWYRRLVSLLFAFYRWDNWRLRKVINQAGERWDQNVNSANKIAEHMLLATGRESLQCTEDGQGVLHGSCDHKDWNEVKVPSFNKIAHFVPNIVAVNLKPG